MSEKTTDPKKKYKHSPSLTASIILVFLGIVLLITLAMFASFDEVTNRFEAGKVDIVLEEPHWDPKDGDETVPNTFLDKDPTIVNKEDTVFTYVFLEVTVPYDDDPNLIIEKAYQDYENRENAGEVVYTNKQDNNTAKNHVPYYKFVATGQKVDEDPVTGSLSDYYDHGYDKTQNVNPRWALLKGYPIDNGDTDPTNKTFTYVYAYVVKSDVNELELAALPATASTEYPLFNQIYLLNFREREADAENNITAFPDPARDYSIKINAYGIQANYLRPNNMTTVVPDEVWEMLKSN